MMKSIIIVFLANTLCFCQMNKFHGNGYKGYILPDNCPVYDLIEGERFVLDEKEVKESEDILRGQIEELNKDWINQSGKCPVIHKNLRNYVRQYLGYIDNSGNKIVFINFLWAKETEHLSQLDKELVIVLDGCSHYWKVKVNLDTHELFDLEANGSA